MLVAAEGRDTTAAIHGVEGMLERGHQRSLAGREWDEEVSLSRGAADAHGTGDTEWHLRKTQKSLDAPFEQLGIYLSSGTADLLNLVPRRAQTLSASYKR